MSAPDFEPARYREDMRPRLPAEMQHLFRPPGGALARWLWMSLGIAVITVLTITAFFALSLAQGRGEDSCRGFIDGRCCCTQGCCFPITALDAVPIDPDGNAWYITATGEEVKRTAWSKDEVGYRCACHKNGRGQWEPGANDKTTCLYPVRTEAGY
jgi:hypothetical protein